MNPTSTKKPVFISLPKGQDVKSIKSSFPIACTTLFSYLKMHGIASDILDFSTYKFGRQAELSNEIFHALKKYIYENDPQILANGAAADSHATMLGKLLSQLQKKMRILILAVYLCTLGAG